MKTILRPLATFVALASLPLAAYAEVRALGRVERIDPVSFTVTSFNIEWPMSGFEAHFDGAIVSAVIDDTGKNWLNVDVDGKVRAVQLKEGRHAYTLYAGPDGPHTIRVTRRTGAQEGPTTFVAISADGLRATEPSSRRILMIGDSIASGFGVEGENQSCRYTQATQNAGLAWPALLAKSFGADLQLLSVDGRGLYRNYDGDAPTMASLIWSTIPSADTVSGSGDLADAIIIHLGTTDFAAGDPGPGFKDTYVDTLGKLRVAYPQAIIIATLGGMLEKPKLAAARAAVEGAVAVRREAGDTRTSFVFLDPPSRGHRFGCDWHPGKDAQKDMAQTLQTALTTALGWKPVSGS